VTDYVAWGYSHMHIKALWRVWNNRGCCLALTGPSIPPSEGNSLDCWLLILTSSWGQDPGIPPLLHTTLLMTQPHSRRLENSTQNTPHIWVFSFSLVRNDHSSLLILDYISFCICFAILSSVHSLITSITSTEIIGEQRCALEISDQHFNLKF